MAWPALIANNVVSGGGVETNGQAHVYRQEQIATKRTTLYFAEQSLTTSLITEYTFKIRMPAWALTGSIAYLDIRAIRKSGNSASGNPNGRFVINSDNGTTVSITCTSDDVWYYGTLDCTAPDDDWASSLMTVEVQGQRQASGVDSDWLFDGEHLAMNFWVVPV